MRLLINHPHATSRMSAVIPRLTRDPLKKSIIRGLRVEPAMTTDDSRGLRVKPAMTDDCAVNIQTIQFFLDEIKNSFKKKLSDKKNVLHLTRQMFLSYLFNIYDYTKVQ